MVQKLVWGIGGQGMGPVDVLKLARVDWIPREREYTSSNKIDKGTLNRGGGGYSGTQIVDIRSF